MATPTMAELAVQCTRFLAGDGRRSVASLLAQIPDDTVMDGYGNGGAVSELETEVAQILGKEKALFLPTGVMTQQATLRVLTDRVGLSTVGIHPFCHLRTHEENAFQELHPLREVLIGGTSPFDPVTLSTLKSVAEPLGAILWELPQRDIGGYLPTWSQLTSQVAWARQRGIACHLDGARLWEAAPFYAATAKKSIADIAALFDTVYVSFYKGLGGISGSCVAGDADVIDEVSIWRTRHGGRAYMLWPYAASALTVLRSRRDDMPAYYRRAKALAARLREIDGIEVWPDEVRSPLMHLRFESTAKQMEQRVRKIAREQKILTLPYIFSRDDARHQRYEFQIGRASMEFSLDEMVEIFTQLAG